LGTSDKTVVVVLIEIVHAPEDGIVSVGVDVIVGYNCISDGRVSLGASVGYDQKMTVESDVLAEAIAEIFDALSVNEAGNEIFSEGVEQCITG